ncbi:hypothetical protein NM688_g1304 [Phlebia brevispora]|uniref:Uncharacterized protein n=1 Tax=Phlebia brevispora TaxID=194682 RepID=A0ACC1TBY9_9APHY|nr:hypothetical protein NM688_g1304 [Phlebia brevispora]
MSVKQIADSYESRTKSANQSPNTARTAKPTFIAHPLLRRDAPSFPQDTQATIDGLPNTLLSADTPINAIHDLSHELTTTTDRTESSSCYSNQHLAHTPKLATIGGIEHTSLKRLPSPRPQTLKATGDEEHEMKRLISHESHGSAIPSVKAHNRSSKAFFDTHASDADSFTSSSTAVQIIEATSSSLDPLVTTHTPIAGATVFSRGAAPLTLPDVDKYISSLPAPSFPSFHPSGQKLFPPLDRLEASGRSLDDLEHNAQIPHWWQSRNKYFGALASLILSITGSSALVSLWSLHGLIDVVQIFALLLNTIGMLLRHRVLPGIALYFFGRATTLCCRLGTPEGLQQPSYMKNSWSLLLISFLLTGIYLPLSTMAIHVLVWSDDLWVVPNPYINATTLPPVLPPLGPPAEFRDPLDFCWTTTMERNEINWAPAVVLIAIVCIGLLTIWFPFHLRRVIAIVAPTVDEYTELGRRRSNDDMDREYQRLLDRDKNPLQFLYHDYRRGWATYEARYLLAKLTALLIVAVVDPDNCLFRTLARQYVQVARQVILLGAMVVFFLIQCFAAPFLDPVGNASEWTSRMNYVSTSLLALLVALNVPGHDAFNGWVLYLVYGITYGLSILPLSIGALFSVGAHKKNRFHSKVSTYSLHALI